MKKNNGNKLKKINVEKKVVLKRYKRQSDEQLKIVAMSVLCWDTKTSIGKSKEEIWEMFPAIVEYEDFIKRSKIETVYSHRVNMIKVKDWQPIFWECAFLNARDSERLIKYIHAFNIFKEEI